MGQKCFDIRPIKMRLSILILTFTAFIVKENCQATPSKERQMNRLWDNHPTGTCYEEGSDRNCRHLFNGRGKCYSNEDAQKMLCMTVAWPCHGNLGEGALDLWNFGALPCVCCDSGIDIDKICSNLKCSEKVKGGQCYPSKQAGMTCTKSDELCKDFINQNSDCYCCSKLNDPNCRDLKCSEKVKGGQCYPSKQAGMTCIKSDKLCKDFENPNSDCYCCSKELPNEQCTDRGCQKFFNGHGKCMTNAPSSSICVVSKKLCCYDNGTPRCSCCLT